MRTVMSVRARITLFILVPLFIVAAIVGYWAYKNTSARAEMRFDNELLATASAISRDISASDGDALSLDTRDLIRDTSGGQVFYHVYAPDGVFVTGYATPPVSTQLSPVARLQFYDGIYHGSPVRVLRLREPMQIEGLLGAFNFTVWQETAVREAYVRDQAIQTFIVITTLTASVALIVWIGVGIGLRPLLDLQHAISIRSSSDLTPIRRAVPDEVKGVVATLNQLLGQVDESLRAKNMFISNAAHQLRNPVAGIMAMAEAVRSSPDARSAVERTSDLYESAQQVSELANKLISFERANQVGDDGLHETINLVDVAKSAVRNSENRVPGSIVLSLNVATPDVPVSGDALMLEEAVTNLIDNALKHGGQQLSAIAVRVAIAEGKGRIDVVDDGVGIAEHEVPRALERFGQLNSGDGTGLGLSIVQSVAHGHGGGLTIEHTDTGLRVVLILPLVLAAA